MQVFGLNNKRTWDYQEDKHFVFVSTWLEFSFAPSKGSVAVKGS